MRRLWPRRRARHRHWPSDRKSTRLNSSPPDIPLFPYPTLFRSDQAILAVGLNPRVSISPVDAPFMATAAGSAQALAVRSEEHPSELQPTGYSPLSLPDALPI